MTRIPLDIVATATGQATGGKIVAVMVDDLDRLEAENARLWAAFSAAYDYIHGGQDRGEESQARYTAWLDARKAVPG